MASLVSWHLWQDASSFRFVTRQRTQHQKNWRTTADRRHSLTDGRKSPVGPRLRRNVTSCASEKSSAVPYGFATAVVTAPTGAEPRYCASVRLSSISGWGTMVGRASSLTDGGDWRLVCQA